MQLARQRQRGAERETRCRIEVEVGANRLTIVPRPQNDALLIEVRSTDEIAHALVAAIDGEEDVADGRRAEDRFLPISADGVVDARLEDRGVIIVREGLVRVLHELPGIQQLELLRGFLNAGVCVERELRGPRTTALGANHDDAVRRARSVDRGRGGVLQDVDRLDLVRADAGDRGDVLATERHLAEVLAQHGNAVDDPQRLIAGGDRRGATNAYGDTDTGIARVLDDLHARRLPLERRVNTGDDGILNLLASDRRDRAAQLTPNAGAVSGGDDLTQHARDRGEHEVNVRRLVGAHRDAALQWGVAKPLHADGNGSRGNAAKGVAPTLIGQRAARGPGDRDLHTGHRLLIRRIGDRSGDRRGALLARRATRRDQRHERGDRGEDVAGADSYVHGYASLGVS